MPDRAGWLLLALVIVLWGAGPLAIGVAVGPDGGFGPLWLNASRLVLGGAVLLGIGAARGRPVLPVRDLPRLAAIGLVAWTVGNGLQVIAQTEVPSGLAALVVSLAPGLALVLEAGVDRRLPALHHVAAIAVGVAGLGLLVQGGATEGIAVLPVVLLVAAALGWAVGAVAQARMPGATTPLVAAAWQMMFGGIGLGVLAAISAEPWPTPSLAGWAGWAFLAIGGAAIGFFAWVEVLRRLPVRVAMTQPILSTVLAVWLGMVVLNEDLGSWAAIGVVLAVIGTAGAATPRHALRLRGPLTQQLRLQLSRIRARREGSQSGGHRR